MKVGVMMVILEKSFAYNNPHLIDEWSIENKISPYEVSKSSANKYIFKCKDCKSSYLCALDKKTSYNSGCPYCRGLKVNDTNSLEVNNKELLIYWDYSKNTNIKPSEVTRNSHKKVFWKCPKCKDESFSKVTSKSGCAVCEGQKIKIGYNDLATTTPEIIKYLKNKNDAFKYMKFSNKKLEFKCPKCSKERIALLSDITKRGFKCMICDTNNSLGERIIHNLLKELDYESEIKFEWNNNKRYDFYIPKFKMIIEVHGEQHYESNHFSNRNLEEEIANDKFKREKALENDIDIYIELKYNSMNLNDFRLEILNSRLYDILNLSDDFKLDMNTHEFDSNKIKCWELYKDKGATQISKELNMSLSTVKKYLKIGNSLGKCTYPKIK